MEKKQKHDSGPNLTNIFVDFLVKNRIPIESIDRNHVKINNRLCFLKHNNASRKPPHEFGIYFWGIGKKAFKEMYSWGYEFFILIGGRNLGKKASSKILDQSDISLKEKELVKLARIEHVFIIPFEIFYQLVNEISPAKNDQLKINIYINQDFKFVMSGKAGSTSNRTLGSEIKAKYLNRFELLGLDSAKSTDLRNYLKSIDDKFEQYVTVYERYRNRLELLDEPFSSEFKISYKRAPSKRKGKDNLLSQEDQELIQMVIEEVLPSGLKNFPDDFLIDDTEFYEIKVPGTELHINPHSKTLVTSPKGYFRYQAKNPPEAKYIVYSNKVGQKKIRIPKDNFTVFKVITSYEKYVTDLIKQCFELFLNFTYDESKAEQLTQIVKEKLSLKKKI